MDLTKSQIARAARRMKELQAFAKAWTRTMRRRGLVVEEIPAVYGCENPPKETISVRFTKNKTEFEVGASVDYFWADIVWPNRKRSEFLCAPTIDHLLKLVQTVWADVNDPRRVKYPKPTLSRSKA